MIFQIMESGTVYEYGNTPDNNRTMLNIAYSRMQLLMRGPPCTWYLHVGTYGGHPSGKTPMAQVTIADHGNPDCVTSHMDIVGPCVGVFDNADEALEVARAHLAMAACSR